MEECPSWSCTYLRGALGQPIPRHTYVGDHESELDAFWLGLGTVATLAGDVGHPIDHPLKTKTPKGPSLVLLTWLPVAGLPLTDATHLGVVGSYPRGVSSGIQGDSGNRGGSAAGINNSDLAVTFKKP